MYRCVGVNGGESLPGSALVDELQDLLSDGQSGRGAEGGQLLLFLLGQTEQTGLDVRSSNQPGLNAEVM